MNGERPFCRHADCQAHTSEEVAYMAKQLRRRDLEQLAERVLSMEVRCRHVPRKGGFPAPLPPRRAGSIPGGTTTTRRTTWNT